MEDASGVDLKRFRLWYAQAGTPRVRARLSHSPAEGRVHLMLEQEVPPTAGQPIKQPMPIPLKVAFYGERSGDKLDEQLVLLEEAAHEIVLEGVRERPVLSINRDFSAPVVIDADRSAADLAFLSARDDNPFARYEAMQQLMLDILRAAVSGDAVERAPVIEAVRQTLSNPDLDPAFIAEAVLLPSEAFIGDNMPQVDPEGIHRSREGLRRALGIELEALWRDAYDRTASANRSNTPPPPRARAGSARLRSATCLRRARRTRPNWRCGSSTVPTI
jgi:aminopeptidase N